MERFSQLASNRKGYAFERIDGKDYCVAQADAPGFETYSTGWRAALMQEV